MPIDDCSQRDALNPPPTCPSCDEELRPLITHATGALDGFMVCVTEDCVLFGVVVSRETLLDRQDKAVEKDWDFRQRMRLT